MKALSKMLKEKSPKDKLLFLRMTEEQRKAIAINYGKHIQETGEIIPLSDFIIQKCSQKVKFNLVEANSASSIRKQISGKYQFMMTLPRELRALIEDKSSEEQLSVNSFVLSEITGNEH